MHAQKSFLSPFLGLQEHIFLLILQPIKREIQYFYPCLPPGVDGVVSGHERGPGRGADGLHVVVLQSDPFPHQGIHVWSQDVAVVP